MLKKKFIDAVIAEDIGRGDLFSRVLKSKDIEAYILAKSNGVFAGKEYIDILAKSFSLNIYMEYHDDGSSFTIGDKLLIVNGDSKDILSIERAILNIALHASSIATLTAKYVEKISLIWCKTIGY